MTEPNDTLRMLEEAASGMLRFDAKKLRQWRDTEPGFDRKAWKSMAEQGWLAILVSEAEGGLGLDVEAAATVSKQLGYVCAPEPFVASGVIVPALMNRIGSDKFDADFHSGILAGDRIACLGWQNANGSLDISHTEVEAKPAGSGFTLTGTTRFVPVAHADDFFVSARIGKEIGIFLVAANAQSMVRDIEPTADGGFSACLTFNGTELPQSACLARGQAASEALQEAIDLGTLANCAELVGNMERSLELTLDYLKTRRQFEQAIGSFQVLQHRSVDIWMKFHVARHALAAAMRTATAPDVPAHARTRAASSAKYRAANEAHFMTNECIQLHGAIGYTDEYDLGLYANRSLAIAPYLGNAMEHRRRYGELKQRAGAAA